MEPRKSKKLGDVLTLLLVGDMATGKTSIITRFTDGKFQEKMPATTAVGYSNKQMQVDGYEVNVQLLDPAGQERFRTITSSYYRGAHMVLLVYDATSLSTMESVSRLWIQEIERYASTGVVLYLVANKIDLNGTLEVVEEGKKAAKQLGIKHLEVSAKTGEGIDEAFILLARDFIGRCEPQRKPEGAFRLEAEKPTAHKKKKAFCSV